MRMHIYAAGRGVAQTLEVDPTARLADVTEIDESDLVYRADDDIEADPASTVAEVFGEGPGHLVVHRCRKVAVNATYTGIEKQVEVKPSARLERVRNRAVHAFGISRADATDLVLRLPGSTEDLDLTLPVGAVVPPGSCETALDLVHVDRSQG